MSRPIKQGMDYFPHDTDSLSDEKIEILRSLYGNDGYVFYFGLLERIYRTENFELIVSDAETRQILARKINVSNEKFDLMLNTSIKYLCFDPQRYENDGVLTSNGIKRRSQQVIEKRLNMRNKYEKVVSGVISDAEMGVEMPQSKVKESKVKKEEGSGDKSPTLQELSNPFIAQYGQEMISEFLNHWTAKNLNGKKELWQMQRVFDVPKRLATWKRNNEKWDKTPKYSSKEEQIAHECVKQCSGDGDKALFMFCERLQKELGYKVNDADKKAVSLYNILQW